MDTRSILAGTLTALVLAGCGAGSAGLDGNGLDGLDPALEDGVELDVPYGPYSRNLLDIWIADLDGLAPVAVYIHGGGFVGGGKESLDRGTRDQLLAAGISVAAINYRFVTTDPMPAPMLDGARAIQFLRAKGPEWRVDPDRMAAFGGSAGGAISMWLCMHDDLAEAESDDPVARGSTRLQAIGPSNGQSSLDPEWMKQWLPGGNTHLHPNLLTAFGVATFDELAAPAVRQLIEEMSAINYVTGDDCPTYMTYQQANEPLPPDATPQAGIHHPVFGIKLEEALDAAGVEAVLTIGREPVGADPYGSMVEFFEAKLRPPPAVAPGS